MSLTDRKAIGIKLQEEIGGRIQEAIDNAKFIRAGFDSHKDIELKKGEITEFIKNEAGPYLESWVTHQAKMALEVIETGQARGNRYYKRISNRGSLGVKAQDYIAGKLGDAIRASTLEHANFDGLNSPAVTQVKGGEITEFIKEKTRLYMESWVIAPLMAALEILETKQRPDFYRY